MPVWFYTYIQGIVFFVFSPNVGNKCQPGPLIIRSVCMFGKREYQVPVWSQTEGTCVCSAIEQRADYPEEA